MPNVERFSVAVQDKKSTPLIIKWIEEMHKLYDETHSTIWKTHENYNTYYLVCLVASGVILFVIMALAILLIHKMTKNRTRSNNLSGETSHRRPDLPFGVMNKNKKTVIPPNNVVVTVYDKKEIPESINDDVTTVSKKDECTRTPAYFAAELEKTLETLEILKNNTH